jgi:hypothetical protein
VIIDCTGTVKAGDNGALTSFTSSSVSPKNS